MSARFGRGYPSASSKPKVSRGTPGAVIPGGSGGGTYSFTGSGTGFIIAKGADTNGYSFAGSGVGSRKSYGVAGGGYSWAMSSGAGKHTSQGSAATDHYSFAGSGIGGHIHGGSSSGHYSFAGSGTGFALTSKAKFFTVAGTFGATLIPFEDALFGRALGNYELTVGAKIDADLWDHVIVEYPGAIFPMSSSVTSGYNALHSLIAALPVGHKFALGGVSQGALIISMIYNALRTGDLTAHRGDLLGVVTFGNPAREAHHTIPGGPDPGGHGIMSSSYRLVGTEDLFWDFANPNDLIAVCGNDTLGQVTTNVFQLIYAEGANHWDLPNVVETVLSSLSGLSFEFFSKIPALVQLLSTLMLAPLDFLFLNNPSVNTQGHFRYQYPYPGGGGKSAVTLAVNYLNSLVGGSDLPDDGSAISGALYGWDEEDRFRIIVEDMHGEIVVNDLIPAKPPKILRALSGPCNIQVDVNPQDTSVSDIYFKPYEYLIHVEKLFQGKRLVWASGILQPSSVDKKTGIISLVATGFSGYAKGLPWLQNWNPLAIDAFAIVHKIWDHIQSYAQGDLNVVVYPAESGIIMLPGYMFDGNIFNLNFFAEFIRAADKLDCGDHIDALARDIPFDYVEQSEWNDDYSAIQKKIYLGYPKAGVTQDNLAFIINENVVEAAPHLETQIDWASDIIVDGWWPGTEYSSTFKNADTNRLRRVIMQDDARINSNERANVWSRRKLSRRQTPAYWDSIIIDMGHPNAPFGSFDVGDRIMVSGQMPTVGDVNQEHKIIAIAVDEETSTCEITLKAEGSFNYDPIYFQGDSHGSKTISGVAAPVAMSGSDPGTAGVT